MIKGDADFKKNELIGIMNDAKEKISDFKQEINEKSNNFVDINKMIEDLKYLKTFVDKMKKLCNKEVKSLEDTIEEIKESLYVEIRNSVGIYVNVLNENLAKQVEIEEIEEEYTLPYLINIKEKKSGNYIGILELHEEDNELKVNLEFDGNSKSTFTITHPYNVYAVVNSINTRYNYEEK